MSLSIEKQVDYALGLAAGQDDPHSITITELCATIASLQKQLAEARAERDADDAKWKESLQKEYERAEYHKARAAVLEAENKRLREALETIAAGMRVILHSGEPVIMARDDAHSLAYAALHPEKTP